MFRFVLRDSILLEIVEKRLLEVEGSHLPYLFGKFVNDVSKPLALRRGDPLEPHSLGRYAVLWKELIQKLVPPERPDGSQL